MKNNAISFKAIHPSEILPHGYKNIYVCLIWDVKIYFTSKARLVSNGNLIGALLPMTYASVVSRDSFRMALMLELLNDFDILCNNVHNAYLATNTREEV